MLEAPDGELCHHYSHLMAQFALLYLNIAYMVEGKDVFTQAIEYQKIWEESSWPKDRRSLLPLQGLAMTYPKNGEMEDAVETTNISSMQAQSYLVPKTRSHLRQRLEIPRTSRFFRFRGKMRG